MNEIKKVLISPIYRMGLYSYIGGYLVGGTFKIINEYFIGLFVLILILIYIESLRITNKKK